MTTTQKQTARKLYARRAFAIDNRKLSRLVEISSERIRRASDSEILSEYTITFADGRVHVLASLEQVLALDNSVGNPIEALDAEIFTWSGEGEKSRHAAEVAISFTFMSRGRLTQSLGLYAWSRDVVWINETMGALEEQGERCIQSNKIYWLKFRAEIAIVLALVGTLLGIASGIAIVDEHNTSQTILSANDRMVINAASAAAKSDSDKINVIFEYVRSMASVQINGQDPFYPYLSDYHFYLIAIPLVAALIAILYTIKTCYPLGVFAWGDWAENYSHILKLRDRMWVGILLTFAIGIVGNLVIVGLSGLGAK